jgi:hypothetical protein
MAALAMRIVFGGLAIGLAMINPEANMLALLDLPTLGLYWLAGIFGVHAHVTTAADPLFFLIGSATWFSIGTLLALMLRAIFRRPCT